MKHPTPCHLLHRLVCRVARALPLPRLLSLTALLMAAGPAAAQEVADAKKVNSLGGVMLSLLMLVGVVIASFMSPRRGPQD